MVEEQDIISQIKYRCYTCDKTFLTAIPPNTCPQGHINLYWANKKDDLNQVSGNFD